MSDLVNELRNPMDNSPSKLRNRAADEIERLRGISIAAQALIDWVGLHPGDMPLDMIPCALALSDALKQEET